MKKSILALEGVNVLSREQLKNVNGSSYVTGYQCTGNFYSNTSGGPATAYECTARYQRTFLGFNYGSSQELPGQVFPCPVGLCESLGL
jgi:hypothetical protein